MYLVTYTVTCSTNDFRGISKLHAILKKVNKEIRISRK